MARARRARQRNRYVFAADKVIPLKNKRLADAQVIGEALEKIKAINHGRLTRTMIWQTAQDPSHSLHEFFEWDIQKAAQAYWDEQAGDLIRSIRVLDVDNNPKHAFVSLRLATEGTSYYSREEVCTNTALYDIMLRQAEQDLLNWEQRYNDLRDLCAQVGRIREEVRRRRTATNEEKVAAA